MVERFERFRHWEVPPSLKPPHLVESIRNKLPELIASAGVGAGVRIAARYGLTTAFGLSGLGLAIPAGAVTGAVISAGRESWHQHQHEGGIHDKKRVLLSALKGAGVGALGAFVGWEISNFLMDHLITVPNHQPGPTATETPQGGGPRGPGGGPGTPEPLGPPEQSDFRQPDATPPPSDATPQPPAVQAPTETPPISLPGDTLAGPEPTILPDTLALPEGSNVWHESEIFLQHALGRPPTNEEILLLSKEVCADSDVRVPEWDIGGNHLATRLPVGYKLVFSNSKKIIAGFP